MQQRESKITRVRFLRRWGAVNSNLETNRRIIVTEGMEERLGCMPTFRFVGGTMNLYKQYLYIFF